MKEKCKKERTQHQEHPPKRDAFRTLLVVQLKWATFQFFPLWTSNFSCYNLLTD